MKTPAKIFIIPATRNQFIQGNNFNDVRVRRIAITVKTDSSFTGSHTEFPFWYQQFNLRQIRILRGGQPIVDFDAADNCCLYVTTMKARNFRDVIPSTLFDNFKNHYVLVFDFTPMRDATETFHYPELVENPLRLELKFSYHLQHVTEPNVFQKRLSSVAVEKFVIVGKKPKVDKVSLQQIINCASYLSIGTLVHLPLTMFQLLILTL